MAENDYDAFARHYSAANERNAWNAHYERPAVLRLLGPVAGEAVLDAGCGAGGHAQTMIASGAEVTGMDRSAEMLRIASERLGSAARLVQSDLVDPLPFENESFDAVLASLVLHYVEDWGAPMREFHRVLKPSGRLVISAHHPFMDHAAADTTESYLSTYSFTERWQLGEQSVVMRFWHRPLAAMISTFLQSSFEIIAIEEPMPDAIVEQLDPCAWHSLTTEPRFLFFRLARRP